MKVEDREERVEYNIFEVIKYLWKRKLEIFSYGLVSLFAVFLILLLVPNSYKSSSVLMVNNQQDGVLSSLGNEYGGLASLAGISMPQGLESKKDEMVLEVVKSKEFMRHLLEIYEIKPELFAVKSFDKENKRIIYKTRIYDPLLKKWVKTEPSYQEVHEEVVNEIVSISKDIKTGFIHISVTHKSPVFAQKLITIIFEELNNVIREKDLQKSEEAINYLSDLSQSVNVQDIKRSINYIMTKNVEQKMLADITSDYILTYIDPPHIPEKAYAPKRFLISVLASILVMMFRSLIILYREFLNKS